MDTGLVLKREEPKKDNYHDGIYSTDEFDIRLPEIPRELREVGAEIGLSSKEILGFTPPSLKGLKLPESRRRREAVASELEHSAEYFTSVSDELSQAAATPELVQRIWERLKVFDPLYWIPASMALCGAIAGAGVYFATGSIAASTVGGTFAGIVIGGLFGTVASLPFLVSDEEPSSPLKLLSKAGRDARKISKTILEQAERNDTPSTVAREIYNRVGHFYEKTAKSLKDLARDLYIQVQHK